MSRPTSVSHFPDLYTVGDAGRMTKMDPHLEYDGDIRGCLCIWEPPIPGGTYVMGIDPTVGRTGWNRYNRVKEDRKTNNGAIEVIRIGKLDNKGNMRPDMQVAEYAAPVDPFDLAFTANMIGRLYAGTEEDQCKCIIEVYPGPGVSTLRQMLDLGYTNHFRWEYYADTAARPAQSLGWYASPKTLRDLWIKASRHVNLRQVIVRSGWLAEEWADCRMGDKDYGENPNNEQGHGDRVRAFNLAVWLANGWSLNIERTQEQVQTHAKIVDWANSDGSLEDCHAAWNEMLDRAG